MPTRKKTQINVDAVSEEDDDRGEEATSSPVNGPGQPKGAGDAAKSEPPADKNGNAAGPEIDRGSLEMKLEAAQAEAQENYERLLRVSAEFENYKKRLSKEMDDFRKYANQELVKELLTVVDNLELALKAATDAGGGNGGLADGVELTLKEILKIFKKFHVKPIEALGKPFDPKYHEAVMREQTDEQPENTVTSEMQRGYMIHDRLLRPAMVVVAMPKDA